ncbi:MAG TPA: hypothetical protein VFG83_00930 [Kofleriaceae bacterium]|nr:hypothetical protein [Kofleriaceae bacterium]
MTTPRFLLTALAAASLATVGVTACGGGGAADDPTCDNGKCDEVPDDQVPESPCDGILKDLSGANHQRVAGRNDDAIAKLALMTGDTCPTSFTEIMAKLKENDTCTSGDGLRTRLVSETAQLMDMPTNYRSVTTKQCNGRKEFGIFFSLFGLTPGGDVPTNVEIIAFDETKQAFNFYAVEPDGFKFFGSSIALLDGPGEGEVRRCAGCHTGGGPIMKEMNSPWMHWEGDLTTPGAQELVAAHADFGQKSNGINLESVVTAGNGVWNKTRVDFLKTNGSVQDLLRPLFCTVEVNTDTGSSGKSPPEGGEGGSELSSVPADSLLDPQLKSFGSISIEFADYDALIKSNGQHVGNVPGKIDTVVDYVFPERAMADNDYVEHLVSAGIVDDDFVKDALMVDFTRPVFSDDRCGLVTFAPDLAPEERTPQGIRDGFIASLEAAAPVAGSPAADFLANLRAEGDGAAHDAAVTAFLDACKGLASADFLENALTITSLNRDKARERQVFEFPETMPDDNLTVDPDSRLSPTTCQVTTEFEAVATEGGTGTSDGGPAMDAGMDPPVDGGQAGVCAHSECDEGDGLEASCSACAATVCADDDFCCDSSWDGQCVSKAKELCDSLSCQ